ncbi:MAG: purine-nucleoside phosphorylase [Oscillospiraceae bacterium]|jgi:purine-nucleoside phosphorylase|nr:purine-nucleoside phosphorylase [Oscillospiraceae bacterium]
MDTYEKLLKCRDAVRAATDFVPEVALVLGSGLGGFGEHIEGALEVPYSSIEGFPLSTVPGHAGKFLFGYVGGVRVVAMQGRVHYYEGYSMRDVVLPIRLMGLLGAKTLFLTNASGGINPKFAAGDFMLIRDQISLFVPSPLIGENVEQLGVRFPDMSHIYSPELCEKLREAAAENGIALKEGVYAQLTGPQFESPAEILALKALGADAVGMSTACEALAARHMGLRVCGVSCVANLAAGISPTILTHEEVQEAGRAAQESFTRLVKTAIEKMKE